ncbi:MAG: hypothetical protein IH606_02805 [Burkholderiales bacterium]|nr:hypothetical protein [Burkholderiales bacterium]
MMELIYRKWYFRRPELAARIMSLPMEGPGAIRWLSPVKGGSEKHLTFCLN